MPGPYPLELDVTIWQAPEATLSRVECEDPKAWSGTTSMTCHVYFSINPIEQAPEPAMSAVLFGSLALAALARRRCR